MAINIKKTNETGVVSLEGNCVVLEGKDEEILKSIDRFLLKWYQVMD